MALRIGRRAPNFSLKNQFDQTVRLSDFRGKNVVMAFFPLAWTPI
jgi:peroxiredoxin